MTRKASFGWAWSMSSKAIVQYLHYADDRMIGS